MIQNLLFSKHSSLVYKLGLQQPEYLPPELQKQNMLLGAATVVLLVCIACLLSFASWRWRSGKGKMPPGPAPIPILGNVLHVKPKNLAKTLQKVRPLSSSLFLLWLRNAWNLCMGTSCGHNLMCGNPRGAEKSWGSQLLPLTAVAIVIQDLTAENLVHTHIYHERIKSRHCCFVRLHCQQWDAAARPFFKSSSLSAPCSPLHFDSSVKSMDQCSQCTWALTQWWCCTDLTW